MNVVSDPLHRRLFPFFLLGLGFFLFLFQLSLTISAAAPRAQETATPTPEAAAPSPEPQTVSEPEPGAWTPVNLSRSGAATHTSTVVDRDGVVHVVWQEDGDDSFFYARGEEGEWSYPARLEFPFGTRAYTPDLSEDDPTPLYQPQFVAVEGGIFAFWIDDEGVAYASSVSNSEFATFSAWTVPAAIAGDVLELSVAVGEGGALHIGYVRNAATAESPAGIYYAGSDSSGADWSEPALLYGSRYFRTLPAEVAHVQVAADGAGGVFVAWDNRPIDQVFVVTSADGGQDWSEAQVVDYHRPDDSPEADGPSQIQVSANGESVHLVWTAGHTTPLCTVYHQWSADGGNSWEEQQPVLAETTNCPERPRLAWGLDGVLFLLTRVNTEARFVAWQEGRWSEAQLQSALSSFIDPANNRRVEFQWQQVAFLDGDAVTVVGAEAADPGDIWALVGSVGTVTDWFPPPSPWRTPVALGQYAAEADDIVMVADGQGAVHAFWTQPTSNELEPQIIEYAGSSDMEWSRPAPVLSSSSGPTTDPSVASGPSGYLYAVWSADPDQLYFSQALAAEASVAREWSEPFMLPIEHEAAASPVIAVDRQGILYVAYALTLNESRGIFLLISEDQGETWGEPTQVFDGVTAAWAMVDEPRLMVAADGTLHLQWVRYSLPPQPEPLALLYARSEDGGESWSEPQLAADGTIIWSQIASGQDGSIHQVWREQDGGRFDFWHSISLDGGLSWSRAETTGLDSASAGAPDLAVGPGGRVHLLNLVDDTLFHSWWEDEGWTDGEPFALEALDEEAADEYEPIVAAAIATDGSVAVLTVRPTLGQDETIQYQLLATGRTVEVAEAGEAATPTSNLAPTQTPTATLTATPATSPTATPVTGLTQNTGAGDGSSPAIPGTGSTVGQIALSLVAVGLLIVVVAVFSLRALGSGRR